MPYRGAEPCILLWLREHVQIVLACSAGLFFILPNALKVELYYRLNYDVPRFMGFDENEKENRIGKFVRDYHRVAGDIPEGVIERLQGIYRQPDVLGFRVVLGFSIAFALVDYALTASDVIQALFEDDIAQKSVLGPVLGNRDSRWLKPEYSRPQPPVAQPDRCFFFALR